MRSGGIGPVVAGGGAGISRDHDSVLRSRIPGDGDGNERDAHAVEEVIDNAVASGDGVADFDIAAVVDGEQRYSYHRTVACAVELDVRIAVEDVDGLILRHHANVVNSVKNPSTDFDLVIALT